MYIHRAKMNQTSASSVKKRRTFMLEKSSSMEYPVSNPNPNFSKINDTSFVSRKSPPAPALEFPTSPQPIMGQEILHWSHPQHPVYEADLPDLFTCAGCKDYGSGKRFLCQQCDFQLHDFCAFAPHALKAHPLHSQHLILFHPKPVKGGIMKSKCDVCGKATKGYAFMCSACGYQMHPCCAMLSAEIDYPTHPHTLRILPATSAASNSGGDSSGFACGECKRSKRSGRAYHCTVCDYHLHAVCAKNKVNGLQANGIKGPEKPSMLGTAARLASQVVIEFIGGLIEGLGEGMGEVLVQNMTSRGGRREPSNVRRTRSTP